jgi:sulfotransferase
MNKNITFLASLPRSGNTLLGALLNQNPDIAVTANSITMEIFKEVYLLKDSEVFKNFPDHDSLDNVLKAILPAYYQGWSQQYIIDRSPAGTPGNQAILTACMNQPPRAILLVRNLTDIFASFLKVMSQRETLTAEKCDQYLSTLMSKDGMIARALQSIQYYLQPENSDRCVVIKYNDLVADPQQAIDSIHKFVGIPDFAYNYSNFDQFAIGDIMYNDTVLEYPLHTIRTDSVCSVENQFKHMIPQRLIDKYGHIVF